MVYYNRQIKHLTRGRIC